MSYIYVYPKANRPEYEAVAVPELSGDNFAVIGVWLPLKEGFGSNVVQAILTNELAEYSVL